MDTITQQSKKHIPWNKGKLTGQKPALKPKEVWSIRIRLQLSNRIKELALFNMAIDSKLRSCDLVKLRVSDVVHGSQVLKRAMVIQQKTKFPVQFEITKDTRESVLALIKQSELNSTDYLFKSQFKNSPHINQTIFQNSKKVGF